ncbi:unnamed protein product [Oncorhynchus mykiss]|uniref:Uncharacterized protein n=1 Tax=Oncorhynchus mykiss TaxID=8022 RepID=A0A060YE94_ONCMY|nr:unnamed protein product [Oncorhynchus mykiss]
MKCFERLVKDHITSTLPETLDPLQFAYRPNRSTDDAIALTLHTALTHLDKRNTYVRMLFIDYSSAFNTIVPSKLVIKLDTLGLDPALCNWVLDNLRRLKKFGLSPKALTNFYRCTFESILSGCLTAWYGNCSAHNRKALQRVGRSVQRITGGKRPALQDAYTTRCHRKAIKIIKDNNHPSHCLFTPLSSRRQGQYRCRD